MFKNSSIGWSADSVNWVFSSNVIFRQKPLSTLKKEQQIFQIFQWHCSFNIAHSQRIYEPTFFFVSFIFFLILRKIHFYVRIFFEKRNNKPSKHEIHVIKKITQ